MPPKMLQKMEFFPYRETHTKALHCPQMKMRNNYHIILRKYVIIPNKFEKSYNEPNLNLHFHETLEFPMI